jgi:hypothetical protein
VRAPFEATRMPPRAPIRRSTAALLVLWLLVSGVQASATYPLRWAPELKLSSLAAIDSACQAEQRELPALRRLEQTRKPASCSEWIELHTAGYLPATEADDAPDRAALLRCGALRLLRRARPAAKSYVRNLTWGHALLSQLPADLSNAHFHPELGAMREDAATPDTLSERDPGARGSGSGESLSIVESAEAWPPLITRRTTTQITPVAWGDFNADGFDDVLIEVSNRDETRTAEELRVDEHARLYAVTRLRKGGALALLELHAR